MPFSAHSPFQMLFKKFAMIEYAWLDSNKWASVALTRFTLKKFQLRYSIEHLCHKENSTRSGLDAFIGSCIPFAEPQYRLMSTISKPTEVGYVSEPDPDL